MSRSERTALASLLFVASCASIGRSFEFRPFGQHTLGPLVFANSAITTLVGSCGLLVTVVAQVLCTMSININVEVSMFTNVIVSVGLALLGSLHASFKRGVGARKETFMSQE